LGICIIFYIQIRIIFPLFNIFPLFHLIIGRFNHHFTRFFKQRTGAQIYTNKMQVFKKKMQI